MRPQALRFSRKLYRHAKGPISEDDFPRPGEDVTVGDKRGNLARERLRGRGKPLTALPERVKKVGQKRPQAFLTHK